MVMGPVHAMSGAGIWLTGAAVLAQTTGATPDLPVVLLGAAVCSGAALLPDIDSPGSISPRDGSTVVRSFGILGEVVGHVTTNGALAVYNLTKTRKDDPKHHGHRTLTHTWPFALLIGGLVSSASALPGDVGVLGQTFGTGQFIALLIMWAMLHLAIFGLFEKPIKRVRGKWGLLGTFAVSGALTAAVAVVVPPVGGYPWLGGAVATGMILHCLGDAITKMGAPLAWPLTIRGKRWYDVAPPAWMRIKADGVVANVGLGTLFTGMAFGGLALLAVPGLL